MICLLQENFYCDTRPLYDFLYSANSDAYNEYIDWLTDVYGDEWQYSFVELNNDGIPTLSFPLPIRK